MASPPSFSFMVNGQPFSFDKLSALLKLASYCNLYPSLALLSPCISVVICAETEAAANANDAKMKNLNDLIKVNFSYSGTGLVLKVLKITKLDTSSP